MPDCLEHTGVLSQLLREARRNKGGLAVVWLDLANAYGSIPHKLVHQTLVRHYVPDIIRELIMDYYSQFHLRISSGSVTSDCHRLDRVYYLGHTLYAGHEHACEVRWNWMSRTHFYQWGSATPSESLHGWSHSHDTLRDRV